MGVRAYLLVRSFAPCLCNSATNNCFLSYPFFPGQIAIRSVVSVFSSSLLPFSYPSMILSRQSSVHRRFIIFLGNHTHISLLSF